MTHRLTRLRLTLAIAGLIMLLGLGLLLRGALAAAGREQQLRREALAARVFDELEGSLESFVAGEEARPFVQWRSEWLSPSATKLSSSPLAEAPSQPFVIGYFQIEPDGSFASPSPSNPRLELLEISSRDLTHPDRLASNNLANNLANESDPANEPQAVQAQQLAVPEDVQIQRALDQQSIVRQRKNVASLNQAFAPDLEQLSNFVGPGNQLDQLDDRSRDALDVRVTKFAVDSIELDRGPALRMVRSVDIAGQRWIQAIVIDPVELASWLELEVLGSPELSGFVDLEWGPGPPADPTSGRWTHAFAAPFAALQVSAELGPVRALNSTGATLILALGIGLGLALIGVLITVERSLVGLVARAEERERFIAAVTHELRTPLTSIRMYSEMLEQGMIPDPERQLSYHGTIRAEAERLSRLVEQILTLARFDERQRSQPIEAERASVGSVVAQVVELLRPQAEARGLELRVALEPDADAASVPRDPLAQIITNLIDNAIKFSPIDGEPIEIAGSIGSGGVALRVSDHGPGVPAEFLARMFEPFVRGQRATEQAIAGTGIGLAVVETLVGGLDGRIHANNRDHHGLAIEFTIPLRS